RRIRCAPDSALGCAGSPIGRKADGRCALRLPRVVTNPPKEAFMNIVARWSIVAGVLGMLVVGGACGGSNSPNPQGLGGSGDPEVDAGVVDNDDAGKDPLEESPSIVDSGTAQDSGNKPVEEPDAGDAG